jgi:glycine cleavage system H protein
MITRFTKDHEYIRVDGPTGTVGITPFATEQLGDIVFVELPQVGQQLEAGEEAAVVESVKAASEIFAPCSGTVTEVNEALAGDPAIVNQDPVGSGWMFRLTLADPSELDGLMDEAAYNELAK